jgi:hypothetical protein
MRGEVTEIKTEVKIFSLYIIKLVEYRIKRTSRIVGMRRKTHQHSARIPEGKRALVWIKLGRTLQRVAFWCGMKGVKEALTL